MSNDFPTPSLFVASDVLQLSVRGGAMEAVIFVGIQGAGKSSFYKERFFHTHVRINLDMLKTKHRRHVLLGTCIEARQPFVIDNTNVTAETRGLSSTSIM